MGVRLPSVTTAPQLANVTVVTTAETIIATLPPFNISLDYAQILLFWWAMFTVGVGGTGVTVRVRRGAALTSPLVNIGNAILNPGAGNTINLSGCYADVPGAVAGQQYVLTVQQTAATANGTALDPAFIAIML